MVDQKAAERYNNYVVRMWWLDLSCCGSWVVPVLSVPELAVNIPILESLSSNAKVIFNILHLSKNLRAFLRFHASYIYYLVQLQPFNFRHSVLQSEGTNVP
jgi:hypothetical protein